MSDVSKTQIDLLGDRLRKGSLSDADIRLLEEYRLSFGPSYASVLNVLHGHGLSPTGRFPKTTQSIVQKLRRESIRLSQMQDIAGCRIVVTNVSEQNQLAHDLAADFPGASVVDRRAHPSHGYRAVHMLVGERGKSVEIQIRTSLQQLWAELSEKASDVLDPAIKYGGGSEAWRRILAEASKLVGSLERIEDLHLRAGSACAETLATCAKLRESVERFLKTDPPMGPAREAQERLELLARQTKGIEEEWAKTQAEYSSDRNKTAAMLRLLCDALDKLKGKTP